MQIYIDESGIITKGQGEYFIVSALVMGDTSASRCLKKIRQQHLKKQYKQLGEIKFNNSSPEIIRRILQCITKHNIEIYCYAYNKKKNGNKINQFDIKKDIIRKLLQSIPGHNIETTQITIDNFLKESQQTLFTEYLKSTTGIDKILYLDSASNPGLQIVDFLCGTIARYYNYPEYEENKYHYSLITDKIKYISYENTINSNR